MSIRSGELFDQGLDFFSTIITRLKRRRLGATTTVRRLDARDLLGHLASSVWVAMSLMQGRQPTWPDAQHPGDLVEGDPVEFWRGTVVQAREVLRNADLSLVMESPLGRTVAGRGRGRHPREFEELVHAALQP
jgi:hypothetical protein